MNKDLMFSSKNGNYGTPQEFYDNLNKIFNFGLDAAATADNTKCDSWLGPGSNISEDALSCKWPRATTFLNPPYGRGIYKWVNKAYNESKRNHCTVVCLLPARTDTKWFQICWKAAAIVFIKNRIKFVGAEHAAPFPSCLVVFSNEVPEVLTENTIIPHKLITLKYPIVEPKRSIIEVAANYVFNTIDLVRGKF